MVFRKIEERCWELYGESAETAMPRVVAEYKYVPGIAVLMRVNPLSVRTWLKRRGYHYDALTARWIVPEAQHEADREHRQFGAT